MTRVVNLRKEKYTVYIGRRSDSRMHFGNPFAITKSCNRSESIRRFRIWITKRGYHNVEPERRQWILDNIETLRGEVLGCFCKPLACHGDVYVELLEEAEDV